MLAAVISSSGSCRIVHRLPDAERLLLHAGAFAPNGWVCYLLFNIEQISLFLDCRMLPPGKGPGWISVG